MKLPRRVIGKVGKCIYCGAIDAPLQDEHPVPYGLNGPWELVDASCKKCANITSKFEQDILRKSLLVPRATFDFPSRHKKRRPNKYQMFVGSPGKEKFMDVELDEHPSLMVLPVFQVPAFYDGREQHNSMAMVGIRVFQVGRKNVGYLAQKYYPEPNIL